MSFDDSSDELASELRDRSQDVGGHPIAFESVRRSARSIQRRRRIAGGAAAAAVLAVAVPAGMAASDTLNEGRQPTGQPTSTVGSTTSPEVSLTPTTAPTQTAETPSLSPETTTAPTRTASPPPPTQTETTPSQDTSPTPTADATGPRTVELTAAGVPRGADPSIAFVDGRTLVLPDGGTVALQGDYFAIAPHQDGWIALGPDDSGRVRLFHLATDGTVTSSQPSGAYALALSHDGNWVLYAGAEKGVLQLAPTSGQHEIYTFHLNAPGQVSPAAVGTITQDPVEDRGVVFYNTDGSEPKAWLADLHGIVDSVRPFTSITGSAPDGALAGQISSSDTGSCSEVMNPDRSKRWETCDHTISRFSPDGRYILASDDYLDGLGTSQVTILDAKTGDAVVSYQRPADSPGFVTQAVWEDAAHVLAIVHEDTGWRVLRLDLDGNISAASRTANADEMSSPFYFSTQP